MTNWLELQFWKAAKWLIRRQYGAQCETKDCTDFPELAPTLNAPGRCPSCVAREVVEWIEGHIELLK